MDTDIRFFMFGVRLLSKTWTLNKGVAHSSTSCLYFHGRSGRIRAGIALGAAFMRRRRDGANITSRLHTSSSGTRQNKLTVCLRPRCVKINKE